MTKKKEIIERYPLNPVDPLAHQDAFEEELPFFQRQRVKNILWLLFFVLVYFGIRHIQQGSVIKEIVPPVQLTTLTGRVIDLSKPQPRPYLIHFWGTWCPICNYEHDAIRKLSDDYPVIAIAVYSTDDDTLRQFSEAHFTPKTIIVNDFKGKIMEIFKAPAVPTDLYVMPNGQIKFVEIGFTSYLGFWLRLWWLEHFG